MQNPSVLVINAGYEPLHRVSLQHAIRMLHRKVAVVESFVEGEFFGPYARPLVLRLVNYVKMRWLTRAPTCSKTAVRQRDGRCAYCGGRPETVDHILPHSRGGGNTWLNLVACCFRCNQRKADRTPEEAGMKLRITPYVPEHQIMASARELSFA